MLTPQEITEKPLSKARFGGYDMGEVDSFLEAVTADYTALYKENAILKGKLKVLVEKVEEYRSTEDSMRMALLTAQRVGDDIRAEANKQREAVLRDAGEEVKARLAETAKRMAEEEQRLSVAAMSTSRFIELSQEVMRKHSEFLSKLGAATKAIAPEPEPPPPPPPPPPTHDERAAMVADQIGSAVERLTYSDPTPGGYGYSQTMPEHQQQHYSQEYAHNPHEYSSANEYQENSQPTFFDNENSPAAPYRSPEDTSATPRPKFDFDDLKFGANFAND
jgi:cell division initiation protein